MRRLVPLLLLVSACAPDPGTPVALTFRATIGDEPWVCDQSYEGVGTTGATYIARTFRFYVHDVRVVTDAGREVPFALTPDGRWQDHEVALVDFETGCFDGGDPETNESLRGHMALADGEHVRAVRFRLGVPEPRNHLLAAIQPAPLNETSMFWGWSAGYEYINAVGSTAAGFSSFLLGATGCTGDARTGTRTCRNGNRADIELPVDGLAGMEAATVVADLGVLLAGIDVGVDGGGPVGCMSDLTDPECGPMFSSLGLSIEGGMVGTQRMFRLETQ